jgi:long-chain fatty acid transport protein
MRARRLLVAIFLTLLGADQAAAQQGVLLAGIGPINQSMGGATVAAPIDALGVVNWNPGAIGGLGHSQTDFSLMLLYPHTRLSSQIDAGPLAALVPPGLGLNGTSSGDSKSAPLASWALIWQPKGSIWTIALGVIETAGSALNYPGSPDNPILSPPPPHGFGVGPITTTFDVLQFSLTAACQITDHLAVGLGPTINNGLIVAEPAPFASPNAPTNSIFLSYPSADRPVFTWGAGVQGGAYYTTDFGWNFGLSIKSPQWFEPFQFHSTDAVGRPRDIVLRLDLPAIYSVGAAYHGWKHWLFAADVRYFDYHNVDGFGPEGFKANLGVRGLGWDSILGVSLGAQHQLNQSISTRIGYTWNQNPIESATAGFNMGSPAVIQHTLSVGATLQITRALGIAVAYSHAFTGSANGPLQTPFGPVPFYRIRNDSAADYALIGATVKF